MIVIPSKECLTYRFVFGSTIPSPNYSSNIPGWYFCALQEGMLLEVCFSNTGYGCVHSSCMYVCPTAIHADM